MKKPSILVITAFVIVACGAGAGYARAETEEDMSPAEAYVPPPSDMPQAEASQYMQEDEAYEKAQPTDNGKVQYISGGVADSGMKAIEGQEKDYNLKILFVAGKAYLADVSVLIKDAKGETLLDTATRGPVLLVKMPLGAYTVEAKTAKGSTLTQRVKISKDHLASYVLRYPAEK